MKKYASIFNEALAPVTPGPSSSNTSAPARIARVCRQLFGEKPARLTVEMSTQGAYVQSYFGMRSDLSFINGIMGRDSLHPRFVNAYEDAHAEGIEVDSRFIDELPRLPIEYARLTLSAKDGRTCVFSTASTGGGTFYVESIDGCKIDIQGFEYELLLFTKPLAEAEVAQITAAAKELYPTMNAISYGQGESYAVFEIKSGDPFSEELLQKMAALPHVYQTRTVQPEHPVVASVLRKPPFETSSEMQAYQKESGLSLWELAAEYEKSLSGWSTEEVLAYADKLWTICEAAIAGGLQPGNNMNGIVPCRAPEVQQSFNSGQLLPLGMLNDATTAALAVMEYSNCSGTIVCIPTGGSSGIVPGAIYGAAKALGKSRDDMLKALLVSGMAGIFMSETNYFGALGCQAEVGCGTAMAAAGLVYLLGGDAKQACEATSMGIQSLLGLVCDPIGGLVQVPCLLRNMTAVSTAATIANAVMAGMEAVVPVEEMVGAMMRVGNSILDHDCNNMGANCTPTGCRLNQEQIERNKKIRQVK